MRITAQQFNWHCMRITAQQFHSRHIVVRYARVREAVATKSFNVFYVPTREQLADGLTKILPGPNFLRHLPFIMGQSESSLH